MKLINHSLTLVYFCHCNVEDISGVFSVAVCGRCSPGGPSRNLCCDRWWMGHHAATDTRRTCGTRTERKPGLCYVNVQMWQWYHELWWVIASKSHNNYHIIGCLLCIMFVQTLHISTLIIAAKAWMCLILIIFETLEHMHRGYAAWHVALEEGAAHCGFHSTVCHTPQGVWQTVASDCAPAFWRNKERRYWATGLLTSWNFTN